MLKVLVFTGATLLSLEGIFALAGIGEQEYLRPDRNIGFIGMANKRVTWRSEGFSRSSFNSFGMHDKERTIVKQPGIKRVAVLGDSFVEALQVAPEQNFCALLENRLPGYEVLNFGASAYNLGQSYLRLKNQAGAFKPDVVLLVVRPQAVFGLVPDVNGGFLAARPTYYLNSKGQLSVNNSLQDDFLKSKEGKRIRATSWLREHSRIWGVISIASQSVVQSWKEISKPGKVDPPVATATDTKPAATAASSAVTAPDTKTDASGARASVSGTHTSTKSIESTAPAKQLTPEQNKSVATKYYWPLAEALILLTQQECKRLGAELVIVRLPASGVCQNAFETELLAKTASDHHIDCLQTDEKFAAAAKCGQRLFYDVHFAPSGHRLLADLLAGHLKQSPKAADTI